MLFSFTYSTARIGSADNRMQHYFTCSIGKVPPPLNLISNVCTPSRGFQFRKSTPPQKNFEKCTPQEHLKKFHLKSREYHVKTVQKHGKMKRRALIYVYCVPGCMENEIRSYFQEIFRIFLKI